MRVRDEQMAALRKDITARSLVERLSSGNGRARYDHETSTIHAHDAVGRRKRIRLGNTGFVEEIRTASGRSTRFLHDADGRILGVQESSGQQTAFGYGPDSQLHSIARNGSPFCTIQRNAEDTLCTIAFWDGSTLRSNHSPTRKPLQIKDRVGAASVFNYDNDDFLTEFINARGESTRFEYNAEGRPATTTHVDGRRESALAYDEMGHPIEVAHNGKSTFTASYSARNCPAALTYRDGSEYKFVRDDKNRLVEATGPGAHTKFSYDEQGLPIEETTNGETFRMEYDASGLLTALEYPDKSRVSFVYDEDKRLVGCTDWEGGLTHFAYDGDRAVAVRTPNRITQQVSLHQNGQPERIRLSEDAQGRVLAETHLEYDIQQRLSSRSEFGSERLHYVYDAESQLTGVYVGERWLENYAYDPAGNRAASHRGPVSVESGNRLTRQGADAYEYDARGNVIASTVDGQPWTFEYDLRNQMVAAHGPSGTVRFAYDALGRRISKTTDSRQTRYVWCGEQLTREIITTDQRVLTRDYLYQPSTYKPLAMRLGTDCYFFHTNHAGTPERISNASGKMVWSARYESFGEAHIEVALVENPLRFQGQYYDDETKLHHNRFRYYSPRIGRYLSVDPIGLLGGHNLYTYVGNDPVNRTDPLGLWWEVAVSALAAGAVAAAVVLTAPVSLPVLAVGALAVMSGVVVGLGVHDGITQYQETGHVCVPCLLIGAAKSVGIGLAVVGAMALAPGAAAVIGGAALVVGIGSLAYTLFNWDNMNHDERMDATGGVLGGLVFVAAARAISGVRGLLRGGGAPEEGPVVEDGPHGNSAKDAAKGKVDEPGTTRRGDKMAGAAKNTETDGDPSVATNKDAKAANESGKMTQLMRDRIAAQKQILETNRRLMNEGKTPEQIAKMSDAEMRAELAKDGVSSEVQGMDTAKQLRNTNDRVQRFNDAKPLTEKDWKGMDDEIGNHGEVKAVDNELQKIETAEGRPATPEDLNKILLHNTQVPQEGVPVTDEAMPRCQHCQGITNGVKVTPELSAAEQSMGSRAQEPVSGNKEPPLVPIAPPGGDDDGAGGSGGARNTGGGGEEEGASGVDSLFD